jgi:hypothetical protein
MGVPQPAFYIFKCEQSAPPGMPKPSCVTPETQDLFQHLAQTLMQKGIIATVQPVRTACLNRCNVGPVMLVEPGHCYRYDELFNDGGQLNNYKVQNNSIILNDQVIPISNLYDILEKLNSGEAQIIEIEVE